MARKARQRAREAEKATSSSSWRTGQSPQTQGPPSWTNQPEEDDQEEQEDEEGPSLDLYSDQVPEQQSAPPQTPDTIRPEFPPGTLSADVVRRIQALLQEAKSFTVINLPPPPVPMPMPKIMIHHTDPLHQGPPSWPESPEPLTPTEPFEAMDPTVTAKSKPPPPTKSPSEAGKYFPSPPPPRQPLYKTPPETQPMYAGNPRPQVTPIRPNPEGPPRSYQPEQPFTPTTQGPPRPCGPS